MIRRKGRGGDPKEPSDIEDEDFDAGSFGEIPVVKDHSSAQNPQVDASAAGLKHWSDRPAGDFTDTFEDIAIDKDLGSNWAGDDPKVDDAWGSSDLTDVFSSGSDPDADLGFSRDPARAAQPRQGAGNVARDRSGPKSVSRDALAANPAADPTNPAARRAPDTIRNKAVGGEAANPTNPTGRRRAVSPRTERTAQERMQGAPVRPGERNRMVDPTKKAAPPTERYAAVPRDASRGQRQDEFRTPQRSPQSGEFAKLGDDPVAQAQVSGFVDDSEDYLPPGVDQELADKIIPPEKDRDLVKAAAVGLALAAVSVAAIFFSPESAIILVGLVALLAVVELFNAMRVAGLRPATLLGLVGTVAVPAAAFYRGEAAYPLVAGLIIVFGALWYLVGADNERPVLNLSLTVFGILWVGGLAGFAGMMLFEDFNSQNTAGRQLLIATIGVTAVFDVMAYVGGRAYGASPFHAASPNKTWEGTLTGFVAAVFVGFVLGVVPGITLFEDNLTAAVVFGVAVGVLAPIGDLTESLVKRDLGVKDMGVLLPGHGGMFDRIDGLLFALPGAYYTATLFSLWQI